jgi:hypothetical protein
MLCCCPKVALKVKLYNSRGKRSFLRLSYLQVAGSDGAVSSRPAIGDLPQPS